MVNEKVIEATGNVGMDQRNRSGASVTLEKLDKRFNTVVAVDEVSLAIEPGEFITLLGPSGSGKTTTLMMIAGFEIPTAGEIYIDGVADRHRCRRTGATSAWSSRTTRSSRI